LLGIINDLRIDMMKTAIHGQPRLFRGSADFLRNPVLNF